ncbi:MAG TPA: hypothetical protein VM123_03560 [archaeon]|nr:hypothetical protein [archaeon]
MRSILFGQFLLEQGLIDAEQLMDGLEFQKKNNKVFGELAVECGLLDRKTVLGIVARQLYDDKDCGDIAVEMGFLSREDRDRLLHLQQEKHVYLGDALVELGIMERGNLKVALESFEHVKISEVKVKELAEQSIKDNPAAVFFGLATKLLPRITGGVFLAGGFYPTIAVPSFDYAFSQRAEGDIDLEAVLLLPGSLFPVMGKSIEVYNGRIGTARGKLRQERAVKSFISSAAEIFAYKQEKEGKKLELKVRPSRISRKVFFDRRRKASSTTCAEFFLISPPDPDGEFFEFNICLIFK